MCSGIDFRGKNVRSIARIHQRTGINGGFFGRTNLNDRDVNMSYEQQARVTFIEVTQAQCPMPTVGISSVMLIMGIGF